MRYPARGSRRERTTLCISSQAGCAVGCPFCATGELGLWRDLRTSEIIDQARYWRNELAAEGRRLTNIVFMGMGEPLLNPDAVLAACAALSDGNRFGLGQRHITVSTSGVIPGIERMTDLRRQYKLAVSLHAARPELRDVLVPLNRKYPLEDVVAAATAYADATGRRVTYEMVMIDRINDTPADARRRGRAAARSARACQPHPHEPGRAHALAAVVTRAGRGLRRPPCVRSACTPPCAAIAASTSVRPAASWRQSMAGEPAPAAVQRRREAIERRSAAALMGERRRRVATRAGRAACMTERSPGAGLGQHPQCRLQPPRPRRPQDGAGRCRPPAPRRHGRAFRRQPHLRARTSWPPSDGSPSCRSTSTS